MVKVVDQHVCNSEKRQLFWDVGMTGVIFCHLHGFSLPSLRIT
jgi:hypothetical protein